MRKASEFSKVKSTYLERKRTGAASGKQKGTGNSKLSEKAIRVRDARSLEQKNQFDLIPNEVLFKIFAYLDIKSLLSCASTCKRWEAIANDNPFWKTFYTAYVYTPQKGASEKCVREPEEPLIAGEKHWKKNFFTSAKRERNNKVQRSCKVNRYTGVTGRMKEVLKKLGAKFQLCLQTQDGGHFTVMERKRDVLAMSTQLQWHTLSHWPNLNSVKKIRIFSQTPIIYQKDGTPLKNGPRQKSLVFEEEIDLEYFVKSPCASNHQVETYLTKLGILIAFWKGTKDIAFVCASLHHHLFVEKCLFSTPDTIFHAPHKIQQDDVSRCYGLQGYRFHFQISGGNASVLCDFCFHSDEMNTERHCRSVTFSSIEHKVSVYSYTLSDTFYGWKTDAFSGTIENLVFLTLTAIDINSEVMWHQSEPVGCHAAVGETVDFDQDSKNGIQIVLNDDRGKVEMFFIDSLNCYCLKRVSITLDFALINAWFGTRY